MATSRRQDRRRHRATLAALIRSYAWRTPKPEKKAEKVIEELPPIDDRIFIIAKLFDLIERRTAILDSLKKIESFKLSTDGNRDELKITDSKTNTFQTSNSAVIKEVIEVIKSTLKMKWKDVEQQIRF